MYKMEKMNSYDKHRKKQELKDREQGEAGRLKNPEGRPTGVAGRMKRLEGRESDRETMACSSEVLFTEGPAGNCPL